MAIYTKTGDKGKTKVFDKKTGALVQISKSSCKIASIGALDELNSYIGVVKSTGVDKKTDKTLSEVQSNLFVINSILAGSDMRFVKSKTKNLEKQIDIWEGKLPVLKNFIFYGGDQIASMLFYTRAICRRSERLLVTYSKKQKINPNILTYINRLSDYLFMMARYVNFKKGIKEPAWMR